jgi:membrane-bound ClpP family serine protease
MAKKAASKTKPSRRSTPGGNLLLTLTLVPLVIGILLIIAWVLDFSIFDEPQLNVTVGVLFLLLSFALSNVLQKRWMLAAGWGLLMCADIIILAWLHVWAQSIALVVGLAGMVFIGIEFLGQYRLKRLKKK